MNTVTTRSTPAPGQHRARFRLRPWYPWLLTGLAFPPAGYLGFVVVGRVDSAAAAIVGGLLTGVGIGLVQCATLRSRGVTATWVVATAAGLAAGLAAGAALVSYRTDRPSLALMGAVSGLAVGLAQGATLGDSRRMVLWGGATAVLWAVGWSVTAAFGIDVDQQFVVFGISGALVFALLQSTIIEVFVPARCGAVQS